MLECEASLMLEWNSAGFIREDSITKYVFLALGEEEGLIYDFNLEVGDTVHVLNLHMYEYLFQSFQQCPEC
ncbi:MAG: hypothetical protein RBS07_07975 [Lentimicrobium sp.]|nr:hypothetical protein [Lentimicrobium sp.]